MAPQQMKIASPWAKDPKDPHRWNRLDGPEILASIRCDSNSYEPLGVVYLFTPPIKFTAETHRKTREMVDKCLASFGYQLLEDEDTPTADEILEVLMEHPQVLFDLCDKLLEADIAGPWTERTDTTTGNTYQVRVDPFGVTAAAVAPFGLITAASTITRYAVAPEGIMLDFCALTAASSLHTWTPQTPAQILWHTPDLEDGDPGFGLEPDMAQAQAQADQHLRADGWTLYDDEAVGRDPSPPAGTSQTV